MKVLIINTHLTYPGWSEGRLNRTFLDAATAFFAERSHPVSVTFVERGYQPEEEVDVQACPGAGGNRRRRIGITRWPCGRWGAVGCTGPRPAAGSPDRRGC